MNENRCGGCHAADRPCEKCELRAENARLKKMLDAANALIGESADETTRLTRRVAKLEEALRPIAEKADMYGEQAFVPRAVMQRAKAALSPAAKGEG